MNEMITILIAKIEELKAQVVSADEAYNKGFNEGVASVGLPSDKIYSQAQVDALVLPLQAQIDNLSAAYNELSNSIDAKINEAVSVKMASIKQQIEAILG